MTIEQPSLELTSNRAVIVKLLVRRMVKLRFGVVRQSYYAGQEYLEDHRQVSSTILAMAIFPGFISSFDFWLRGAHVFVFQRGNLLQIVVEKTISQLLIDDIRLISRGHQFIVGYLYSYMSTINTRLMDQRYNGGHLLIRTFSVLELFGVQILSRQTVVNVAWPPAFAPFPKATTHANNPNAIYLRDYIDACQAFLRNDYDDCIRRIITSAENFVQHHNWKVRQETWQKKVSRLIKRRKKPSQKSFRRILAENLNVNRISGHAINENMQYIYTVRNRIVHAGYRVPPQGSMFCNKAIGTIKYLLEWYAPDRETSEFVKNINMQFLGQCHQLGENGDLDLIRKINRKTRPDTHPIDTAEAFNKAMFSALRFTQEDKRIV